VFRGQCSAAKEGFVRRPSPSTTIAAIVGFAAAIGLSATAVLTQVQQSGGGRAAAPTGTTVLRVARLYDGKTGTIATNQVILINGDRIADVGPNVAVPAGANVIDLGTATALPGMIDTHLHVMPQPSTGHSIPYKTLVGLQQARNNLMGGFTTIVDLSARHTWATIDIRNAINRGVHVGPRMQVSGPEITPRDRSMAPTPTEIDGSGYEDELFVAGPWMARHMVRKLKHYGADWVKIYAGQDFMGDEYQHFKPDGTMVNSPSLTLEETQAIVDEAHRRGMRVACHSFGGEGLASCVTAGVDKVEHGNVMPDSVAKEMAQKKIALVFTLSNMLDTPKQDLPRSGGKVSRLSLMVETLKKVKAAGVPIAFGSDTNPPGHGKQSSQFKHYVEYGLTPAEALNTAFMGAANVLNYDWAKQVGSIEKGKYADIIGVAGDPLKDVSEMERVKFVMKGGVVVKNELTTPAPTPTASR
jgi:imidazolonepropionase-like amidohydrolase